MTFQQLSYFIAAAEMHSISRAASRFYISQTAITQQIRSLEEQLQVTLFDRSHRPLELTPAGAVFLVEARALVARMEEAKEKTREASTGLVGNLRIGYLKGYERSCLSDCLRLFHRSYPNVLLSLYRCDTDRLAEGLISEEYDVVFTWDSTNMAEQPAISQFPFEKAPLSVVLYDSHPLAARPALHRSELRGEKIIFLTPSSDGNSYGDLHFLEMYREAGFQPDILIRSNDIESCLIMVAAEEGISIVPSYVSEKLADAVNLTFVPLSGDSEYEQILCAWNNTNENPALWPFLDIMRENADPPVSDPS